MIILQPTLTLADPHICTDFKDRLNMYTAVFDVLVRRDLTGKFVPQLAKSWQVSADACTWTFVLRDDIVFHNGDRFSADDVVGSITRACDPAVGGELGTEGVWASYLGDATLKAINEQTFEMQLARPMADLCELLMAIPIMPKAVLPDVPNVFVGSGPYRMVSSDKDEVVLEPFEKSAVRQPSSVEPLIFRAEPDEAKRLAAFKAGKADLVSALSQNTAAELSPQALAHESNLCVAFLINCMKGPGVDKRIRQALNYAVDVQAMIDTAHNGAATPLSGPLTDLHFGCDPAVRPYPYDRAKAGELVAMAKADGFNGKLDIDIPMILPNESPLLGEMIAQNLAEVGIEVTLHHYDDRPAYAHMVKDKRIHDVCCFDSSPLSTYRVLREKINSDVAGPWWQGYDNSAVNALLDKASATVDDEARQALYREAYAIMHDDAPWIFLYRPTIFWGIGVDVPEFSVSPEGLLRFEAANN
ncbi:MAG: peptide/nickel transport system substrate-binding protein [Cellvibrionaceae bacterium]|jgi:peptide/nickel transport system substrate-binding protein